ncbi:MAG TPA: hypothetical protein V6D17_15025 [Candidatus Obscuribacterales bacterium]
MEIFLYAFGGIVALLLLVAIAEPHRFFPEPKDKKMNVGATYWGFYEGLEADSPEHLKTIEVKRSKRKETVVAGATTYAAGRGVSMRGA